MLSQVNHWLEIVATAVDFLLLGRVLLLKLHRLYLFITLACVLTVLFDSVQLWLGNASNASVRVFIYSRFLWALLFPLVAWDVFEELKGQIAKLRRVAIGRLASGLFFAVVFSLLASAFTETDANGEPSLAAMAGIVLWAGSATASLAFLWSLHRSLRTASVTVPHNTHVWLIFYELSLLAELASCFTLLVAPLFKGVSGDLLNILFMTYGVGITGWCILRLRGSASDSNTESEQARP